MKEHKEDNREESQSFKVADRRKFTADGDPLGEVSEQSGPAEAVKQSRDDSESEASKERKGIDFSGFLISLATSAMAHLGEVPDPTTGRTEENLDAARQMIDILELLKEKTLGNLDVDEVRLLDSLLYELRMTFLNKVRILKT